MGKDWEGRALVRRVRNKQSNPCNQLVLTPMIISRVCDAFCSLVVTKLWWKLVQAQQTVMPNSLTQALLAYCEVQYKQCFFVEQLMPSLDGLSKRNAV